MPETFLHPLSDFLTTGWIDPQTPPSYHYRGQDPQTEAPLSLARSALAEAVAHGLMNQLEASGPPSEGKMYGVCVVTTPDGRTSVLKAFSGLLEGEPVRPGWVPPLPGRELVAMEEARVLAAIDGLSKPIQEARKHPSRAALKALEQTCKQERDALALQHKENKRKRQQQREALQDTLEGEALLEAEQALDRLSQDESFARRRLKKSWDQRLASLRAEVEAQEEALIRRKAERRALSRQLQQQMHMAYTVVNFSGRESSLEQLFDNGRLPSGTGDCCAPKLLHFAATHGLQPLGMAEFWWGPPPANGAKEQGTFYGACAERCQPLMGFMLSGLHALPSFPEVQQDLSLHFIYEDDDLLVIDKPSGLLSIPGRGMAMYDSVMGRAKALRPSLPEHIIVHRLDMETSGIMLLAKHHEALQALMAAFAKRRIKKTYEAIVDGIVEQEEGTIALPLISDPEVRLVQKVDFEKGKKSTTHFRVLAHIDGQTRLALFPVTGRTHQLRVHTSDPRGLGMPIVGDSLYHPAPSGRLLLHAKSIELAHPITQKPLCLTTEVPF